MSDSNRHCDRLPTGKAGGSWSGRRVCVTGGTGFLGWHIVKRLRHLGAVVTVLGLDPGPDHPLQRAPDLRLCFGDIRDEDLVRRAVDGAEVVFHAAGVVASWGSALRESGATHDIGTQVLLKAAPVEARIVHTSSALTIGGTKDGSPLNEESECRLDDLRVEYVRSKLASERRVIEAAKEGRDIVITNPGFLLGPDDYGKSIMGRLCWRAWRGRMPVAIRTGLNVVDVRDVARGHLLAAEHGARGRRYLLAGENLSMREIVCRLVAAMGCAPRCLFEIQGVSARVLAHVAEAISRITKVEAYPSIQQYELSRYYWYFQSDRAEVELGFTARAFNETVRDSFAWFQGVGLGPPEGLNRLLIRRLDTNPRREAA